MDIRILDNTDAKVSIQIHQVMQESYRQEAALLGLEYFPPLERSAKDIANDRGVFYGASTKNILAGILHFNEGNIDALVVEPSSQGLGVASALLNHLIGKLQSGVIRVSTAQSNTRAVSLYQKFGFKQESTIQKEEITLVNYTKEI